jgi:hypothetical protein
MNWLRGCALLFVMNSALHAATMNAPSKVYIESNDSSFSADAVHLALSSSKVGWTADKGSADVILSFSRDLASTDTTTSGTQTSIAVHWTITLKALNKDGVELWHESQALDTTNFRKSQTEEVWLTYLRRTEIYKLTKDFLSQVH